MKTILVPLDGSPLSEQALPYAELYARTMRLPITLLRVVPDLERESLLISSLSTISAGYSGEAGNVSYAANRQAIETFREQALGYLDAEAETLRAHGLQVATSVQVGGAAEIITEYAAHTPTAVIVMATHGYSGLQRWTIGSVADKVIHNTHVPLLLIRGTMVLGKAPQLKTLLVPLDGSELARQALPVASEIARAAGARVTLLHAVDPLVEASPRMGRFGLGMRDDDALLDDVIHNVGQELDTIAQDIRTEELEVTTMTIVGYPAEVIVDEAERRSADLIVMATHGYSGIRRWALGSIADKVLHTSRTPLMLVRAA